MLEYSDRANLKAHGARTRAIAPSTFFDDAFTYHWTSPESGLPPSDQLYTARGSQGISASQEIADFMIPDLGNYTQTLLMQNNDFGDYNVYYQKRVLWTLHRSPDWDMFA